MSDFQLNQVHIIMGDDLCTSCNMTGYSKGNCNVCYNNVCDYCSYVLKITHVEDNDKNTINSCCRREPLCNICVIVEKNRLMTTHPRHVNSSDYTIRSNFMKDQYDSLY